MATKKEELAMTLAPEAAMTLPSYIKADDHRGRDAVAREDIQMPRIAIAQQMSPELVEDGAKFVEGLKQGEMFNSLTQEVIGKGPIQVAVIRRDPPRYVEFNPRDQGGGVKDPNVPPNDPRTRFGPNGEQPLATKFYDMIVMRLDRPGYELIAISLKSTGLKVARAWNGLIQFRMGGPSFAGKYALSVVKEENAKGKWYNFSVKNMEVVSEADYPVVERAYESLKDKEIVIHRENDDAGGTDTTFDTTSM